jgi:hypothetical protein
MLDHIEHVLRGDLPEGTHTPRRRLQTLRLATPECTHRHWVSRNKSAGARAHTQQSARNRSRKPEDPGKHECLPDEVRSQSSFSGWIQITDDYWPYERSDSAPGDPELRAYLDRIQEMLEERACVRHPLSEADELLAREWYARGDRPSALGRRFLWVVGESMSRGVTAPRACQSPVFVISYQFSQNWRNSPLRRLTTGTTSEKGSNEWINFGATTNGPTIPLTGTVQNRRSNIAAGDNRIWVSPRSLILGRFRKRYFGRGWCLGLFWKRAGPT